MYLLTDLTDKLKKKKSVPTIIVGLHFIEYVYTGVYIGVDFIF